jgi:hypothetical protein
MQAGLMVLGQLETGCHALVRVGMLIPRDHPSMATKTTPCHPKYRAN